MYHRTRWTPEKIRQRLELIAPLVYIKTISLPSFRYRELESALAPPPIGVDVADSDWQTIDAHEYWGGWLQNFVLRTMFTIPAVWDTTRPIALFLLLGEAGDFSHPEALAYIDGEPFAACDRHHQEILLKQEWAEDGNGIIVRLYESQRKRGPVQVRAGFGVEAAWETNLLEENESALHVENDSMELNLRPYQIMTIRITPNSSEG